MVFLSPFREMPEEYIKLSHGHFLPYAFNSLIFLSTDDIKSELVTASFNEQQIKVICEVIIMYRRSLTFTYLDIREKEYRLCVSIKIIPRICK